MLVVAFAAYNYIFSIYEVDLRSTSDRLYADYESTLTIEAVPLNSFGNAAPFRSAPTKFSIVEGRDLIEIVELDEENGRLTIRALGETGRVVISSKPEKALLPTLFTIEILPSVV